MARMKKKKQADYLDPEKIIHPETGEADLVKSIRYIVEKLHQDPEVQKEEKSYTFQGSMTDKLRAMNFNHVSALNALLQELGIATFRRRFKPTIWQIVDEAHLEYCLHSEETVAACVSEVNRDRLRSLEHSALKLEKLQREEASEKESGKSSSPKVMEQVSDLFVTIENLQKEVAEKDKKLEEMEKQLSDIRDEAKELRERPDMDTALAEAIAKRKKELDKRS